MADTTALSVSDTVAFSVPRVTVLPAPDTTALCTADTISRRPFRMAARTNLLFDAVGAPNLGIEIPWGKNNRFSTTLDFTFAWWRIDNLYALQTIHGGIGVKYWFNPRRGVLTGWSAGVYGIYGGPWDVQWKDGWQGNSFWSTGITLGYATPLTKRLNLEFALAGGYFYTPEARYYHRPEQGHLMWRQTRRNMGRFSLTGAQVNLVWLIGGKENCK